MVSNYVDIFLVNLYPHKHQEMEKVNPGSHLLQQGLDQCIQSCITLQKDIAMIDPYVEIAGKGLQIAKQEISAIVDPVTKEVGTLSKVPVNIPAPKLNGPLSMQTRPVTIHKTTAEIDTIDTKRFLVNSSYGRFNKITVWNDAVKAMEDAVKEAQDTLNNIFLVLQSVISAIARWMNKDETTLERCERKCRKLSLFVEVYYRNNVLMLPVLLVFLTTILRITSKNTLKLIQQKN
jgi:hypothetical protein